MIRLRNKARDTGEAHTVPIPGRTNLMGSSRAPVPARDLSTTFRCQVGKVSVNTHLLVVKETGDWLSVIPIVIPIESALRQLVNLWDSLSEQLARDKTAKATGAERDALVYELVTRAARTGPIAGGKDAAETWALRRQGDMLYLVSSLVAQSRCLKTMTAARQRNDFGGLPSVARRSPRIWPMELSWFAAGCSRFGVSRRSFDSTFWVLGVSRVPTPAAHGNCSVPLGWSVY